MLPLVALLVVAQVDAGVGASTAAEPEREPFLRLSAGLEAEAGVFPSGTSSENGADVFFGARPMVGMRVADVFALQLGPLLRFRVIDTPTLNRGEDVGGVLRGRDWDRLGDFGELLQSLRIGNDTTAFQLRAGPVHQKTMGQGHLLFRYSNRLDADARPAGATATLGVEFFKVELFASDVLAARLFAGELTWDIGRTFSSDAKVHGRYLLSLSGAHDFGLDGQKPQPCPFGAICELSPVEPRPATLGHLDASAVVLRAPSLSVMVLGGVGARANQEKDLGFLLGAAMDVRVPDVELSLRGEARKQAGGFRHGFFGAQYELARVSGLGFASAPIADERLPDAFSIFGELRLRLAQTVTVDGGVEVFTFGRTDFDSRLSVELLEKRLIAEARFGAMGLGQTPRWLATAGLRWRLFRSFYVLGSGGTVFFAPEQRSLVRGVTVMAGVGVDIER